ncbi:transcription factor jumonji jmjC domain-containing protein [Thioalkalivibrio nitratireducens DSM 14787]|uniref:Transcription factor jumonji jmjC domain-containing protein n=1 Tax=Thioalkalivibrio nitratireducens (strain DSM 14787 / UNIQEM 213 / ALEN2) TaxID=1255043 RepID=L0DW80_THIND|nr:cupin domain-containing protein [Thioalkalivibrio nitratireducens]AGA33235.1 transcription factor jumonji jmjC domain-containing protein [Thioalkalivibrio nitratireducens DSM 14787]
MDTETLLGGLTPEAFLRDYWQQCPLLIRQAIPGFVNPIDAEDLAGLACEEDVRSRLVIGYPDRRDWQVEYGPFRPERFANLPETAWTLLVSEVEQYWPPGPEWLQRFDFIPRWRRDDLMISYAVQDGSVGPHIDAYDVFLFQAQGRRRWQIQEPPPKSPICLPDLPLAILRSFTPTTEWVLEPGDMLYLPPGIPHLGMALDDDCMTWSIGFRAPAWRDLVGAFLEDRLDSVGPELVTDSARKPSRHAHELGADDLAALRDGLLARLRTEPDALHRFFGEFLTRPQTCDTDPETADDAASEPPRWDPKIAYRFDPSLRRYWIDGPDGPTLFLAGHAVPAPGLSLNEAESLCQADTVVPEQWATRLPGLVPVFRDLLAAGQIEPDEPADTGEAR